MRRFGQSLATTFIGEAVKAIAVLALFLLSFAPHSPVFAATQSAAFVTSSYYCGEVPGKDHGSDHRVCHACRAGIADLPPPPLIATRCEMALDVQSRIPGPLRTGADIYRVHPARAPPSNT